MAYNFSQFQGRTKEIEEWLKKELSMLRTGRATSVILDSITVESYGSHMPIAHVANISTEDARTLRISPYDKSQVKAIESAIQKADLGLGLSTDDTGLRVSFPELTGERRSQIVKILHGKLEEARISLRKSREEIVDDIKKKEKAGEMSEDDAFKAKEALQKLVDESNAHLESSAKQKETEIAG